MLTNAVRANTTLVNTLDVDALSRFGHAPFVAESIKDRILWILADLGIGQRELGRRAKLKSETHVQRILQGDGNLQPDTIAKIAEAANVRYEWLALGRLPIREVAVVATIADVEALVEKAVARATEKPPPNLLELYVRDRIVRWRRANPARTVVDFAKESKLPQSWVRRAEGASSRIPREQLPRWRPLGAPMSICFD